MVGGRKQQVRGNYGEQTASRVGGRKLPAGQGGSKLPAGEGGRKLPAGEGAGKKATTIGWRKLLGGGGEE
jgi:hypothetical protein